MNKFIAVDYQEGAGGEFISRFISAHFGHRLEFNQQTHPDNSQQWLNSHSLVKQDWDVNFATYFNDFLTECDHQNINEIAVSYHLYKWPKHVAHILNRLPHARFVKINCEGYYDLINTEHQRKVQDKIITDFRELQFMLSGKDKDFVNDMLKLYRQKKLTYRDIFPTVTYRPRNLPSNDIEINYRDFFCEFDRTANAYQRLCNDLEIEPDNALLSALLERNKKNQQDLNNYLNKI